MTVKQLYQKYEDLRKKGFEQINISQVLNDLYQIQRTHIRGKKHERI